MTARPNAPLPLRHHDSNTLAPPFLIRGLAILALCSLAMVAWARWTDRPLSAVPPMADVVRERTVILSGGDSQAVTVRNADGTVLIAMEHGGFVTVIQNGLQRARLVAGVQADLPIRLVEYANGRLSAQDPLTGWSVELGSFGADNRAAFERLMDM